VRVLIRKSLLVARAIITYGQGNYPATSYSSRDALALGRSLVEDDLPGTRVGQDTGVRGLIEDHPYWGLPIATLTEA